MKKVLIVEDDAWLADNYRLILEQRGWQVTITSTAADAMNLIDDITPSVILLDFMLPTSSAPALLNEIQSHTDIMKLPVVLYSSLDLKEYGDLSEYGVYAVLDKTKVSPEDVVKSLEGAYRAAATQN